MQQCRGGRWQYTRHVEKSLANSIGILNAISNDANAEYYDANGRRTNGLQKGLNIVKRGSKTYKIMVK